MPVLASLTVLVGDAATTPATRSPMSAASPASDSRRQSGGHPAGPLLGSGTDISSPRPAGSLAGAQKDIAAGRGVSDARISQIAHGGEVASS